MFIEKGLVMTGYGEFHTLFCKLVHWPFSQQRRIIRPKRVICWIIRARQTVRLNLKIERFEFLVNNLPDFIHLFIRQFSRILKMAYLSQIIRLSCENCHDNREENLGFYHVSQFGVAVNSRNTSFFFLSCSRLCDSSQTRKFNGQWSHSCFHRAVI